MASAQAYAQWVHMVIQNKMASGHLSVKEARAPWGKFYKWDNKDDEISTGDVNKQVATQSKDGDVAGCGRSNASSGTEGSFDIYDGDRKVCHIYWDCPWGSKTNTFNASDIDNAYIVQHTGANLDGGAIGTVTIKVAKIG